MPFELIQISTSIKKVVSHSSLNGRMFCEEIIDRLYVMPNIENPTVCGSFRCDQFEFNFHLQPENKWQDELKLRLTAVSVRDTNSIMKHLGVAKNDNWNNDISFGGVFFALIPPRKVLIKFQTIVRFQHPSLWLLLGKCFINMLWVLLLGIFIRQWP